MSDNYNLHILYEDKSCILVEKPQGILSEDAGERSLPYLLRKYRKERGEPEEIYPVHRLDKPTGGAILYAKTGESAATLSDTVVHHEVGKRYLAVAVGVPQTPMGRLCDFLYHDKRTNKVFCVKRERKGAKKAVLDYRTIATAEHAGQPLTLLEVNLVTGRTHQIRAQFASRKLPVYGDRRYGCREGLPCGRIALWSHCLIFTSPCESKARVAISVPPDEFPWSLFPQIASLRRSEENKESENFRPETNTDM